MCRTLAGLAALAICVPSLGLAQTLPTIDDPVPYARSAGPLDISADATVIDGEGNVLAEGTNGWTCVVVPDAPMCLDAQWMIWMDALLSGTEPEGVTAVGLAYMLRGDGGASNVDPFAEVPDADNDWVVTGPHIMMIVPDPALLAGIPTDPTQGGPYVMWPGHPLAHVMIPVEDGAVHMPHGH